MQPLQTAVANDITDRGMQGFPTLKLYPAGSKHVPVFFSEARTLTIIADFIRILRKQGAESPGIGEEEDKMATSRLNERSEQASRRPKRILIAHGEPSWS